MYEHGGSPRNTRSGENLSFLFPKWKCQSLLHMIAFLVEWSVARIMQLVS